MTRPKQSIQLSWVAFLVFAGIGFFGYLMKAVDGFHSTPGDLIDARFNSVILEHLYRWLRLGLNGQWTDIWSPGFFYPYKNVLAFSDNHFGSGIIYILFRHLGFPREISFGSWFAVGFCLNFLSCYWVLRRFQFSIFSSSVAAFVFAFSLPVIAQDIHSQFSYRFGIPLAFLALWNLLNNHQFRSLAWLAFWICLQFLCSIYMGIFLSLFLIACLLPMLLLMRGTKLTRLHKSRIQGNHAKWIYLGMLIFSIGATLALGIKYHQVSQQYGFHPDQLEVSQMIPRLESYLLADRSPLSSFIGNYFAQNLSQSPYKGEHQLFLGIGVFLFWIAGIVISLRNSALENQYPSKAQILVGQIACITLLTLFIITLMFGVGSLWNQLAMIPGLKFIRAITRVILVMIFPISILVAIACEKLYYSHLFSSDKKKFFLIISSAILICSETLFFQNSKTPNSAWAQRIQNLERSLPANLDQDAILFVAKDENQPGYELPEVDAMVLAQDHEIPTVNGYSGKFPPGNDHNPAEKCISAQERLESYITFTGPPRESIILMLMKQIIKIPNISCNQVK